MSDTNTTGAVKASKWSEAEELALLRGIIRTMLAGGAKINWKNAELPLGRTVRTCKWKYDSLMANASDITMSSGDAIAPSTPAKKRGKSAKKAAAGANEDDIGAQTTTPTKRNKRKSPIDDDDAEATSPKKNAKVKVEQAEEDLLDEEVADDAV